MFRAWIVPSAVLFGAFAIVYVIATAIDFFLIGKSAESARSFLDVLTAPDAANSKDVLGTIGQVVPGILGIAITVVAIIVELASNRYSSKVTDLFIRDRINLAVTGLFVISSIYPLWVMASYGGGYVPRLGFTVALVLASLSILLLIPYFSYVFAFLAPANIINTIRTEVRRAIRAEVNLLAFTPGSASRRRMLDLKLSVTNSVEQLADIALNSIVQRDRALGMDAVNAARGVVFDYFEQKPKMPPAWFLIDPEERVGNPDYVTLSQEGLEDLQNDRVWVEHKVMKQLHLVFAQALNNLRDLNNLVAMFLKDVAIEALKREDRPAHRLALKYFNTSLRSAFAAKDVRTAYNILYQYRSVAEELIRRKEPFLTELVFGYFKYYGQLFDSGGLGFILETVAYDLEKLIRVALAEDMKNVDALLAIFLDVDRAPDVNSSDVHLRGVRKAQVTLASFCISKGRRDLAERIAIDMKAEPHDRLRSIREELHAAERAFWEITDRGVNFDYLEAEMRPHLDDFYDNILKVTRAPTNRFAPSVPDKK
ncbi:MAG: DUF2254 family protein [Planctomycetota bacterium]